MNSSISVENLSKCYRVHHTSRRFGYRRTLRDALVELVKTPWRRLRHGPAHDRTEEFWALQNINFEIQQGEVVGIIGRNGAGKSTLLKILSQITKPTTGQARFRGRVGSLLEVGTGFHPELTGRENIYLNGGILGMSRREINRNFDDIVAFAEIGQFLDTPVKRYSSGMYVRLTFAVAAHLRPEILVVDEVLAVGDTAFQKKCLGKMGEVSRSGRTIILVSHNMASILNLCQKVVVLEQGKLSFIGPCDKGVDHYLQRYDAAHGAEIDLTEHPNRRPGSTPFFRNIRLLNSTGRLTDEFVCGESMTVEFLVDPAIKIPNFDIEICIEDTLGVPLVRVGPYFSESGPLSLNGQRRLVCQLEQLPLVPGNYCLSFDAGSYNQAVVDALDQAVMFTVVESDYFGTGKLPDASRARFLVRSKWLAADE